MIAAQRPLQQIISSLGTILAGMAFVGVGIGSVVVRAALFSWGVGAMLVLYGGLLILVGWSAWRGYAFATGAMVATALLNTATVGSYATGTMWYLPAIMLILPVTTLIAAIWLRVIRAAEGNSD